MMLTQLAGMGFAIGIRLSTGVAHNLCYSTVADNDISNHIFGKSLMECYFAMMHETFTGYLGHSVLIELHI